MSWVLRIRRGAAVVAVSFAALVAVSTATAHGAAAKIAWSKCFGGPFQCGTLQVPLEYSKPNGTTISLAIVKLPATDAPHRIGSLLLNPGGPGGSGVDYVVGAGPVLYTPEVRARFDLVGFDPRGVARSAPLRCFGTINQAVSTFSPFAFPMTRDELSQSIANDGRLLSACDRRGGGSADHIATRAASA